MMVMMTTMVMMLMSDDDDDHSVIHGCYGIINQKRKTITDFVNSEPLHISGLII